MVLVNAVLLVACQPLLNAALVRFGVTGVTSAVVAAMAVGMSAHAVSQDVWWTVIWTRARWSS